MDKLTKEQRSKLMSKIHQPTKLEARVHQFLIASGIEHEMYPRVEGRPDLGIGATYFFIDGCFWHCCPSHYRRPKSNLEFWVPHIEESNKRREEKRKKLPYEWVRIWEHDVENGNFKDVILEAVER